MFEGYVIIIRNFKASESTGEYTSVSTQLKISFLGRIAVKKLPEESFHILESDFQFIQTDMIHSRVCNNTVLSAILIPTLLDSTASYNKNDTNPTHLIGVVGCLCGKDDIENDGLKWIR